LLPSPRPGYEDFPLTESRSVVDGCSYGAPEGGMVSTGDSYFPTTATGTSSTRLHWPRGQRTYTSPMDINKPTPDGSKKHTGLRPWKSKHSLNPQPETWNRHGSIHGFVYRY